MKTRNLTLVLFAGLFTLFFYSCGIRWNANTLNDTVCSNYSSTPKSELPIVLINDMVQTYKDNQLAHINNDMSHLVNGDARAIRFDLETLKSFIYHLENVAKNDQKNPTKTSELGLRIYYASYPKKAIKLDGDKYGGALDLFKGNKETEDYGERHTLVMIPTIKRQDGVDVDFNPLNPNTYETGLDITEGLSNPTLLTYALLINTGSKSTQLNTQRSSTNRSTTNAQNHGSLYPPYSINGMSF